MAINYSYPKDLVLENSDLFLGIRASDNRTVNYTAQAVSDFLNTNGEISISSQLSFRFTIVENQPKTISFPGGGGNNTLFSNITELVVSIIDVSSSNVTVFLNYLIDSDILLSQQNEPNLFGHYKITGYTQNGISPFYTLTLEFIGGSGNITDETYYDIAPLNLSQGNPLQDLQSVVEEGRTFVETDTGTDYSFELFGGIGALKRLYASIVNAGNTSIFSFIRNAFTLKTFSSANNSSEIATSGSGVTLRHTNSVNTQTLRVVQNPTAPASTEFRTPAISDSSTYSLAVMPRVTTSDITASAGVEYNASSVSNITFTDPTTGTVSFLEVGYRVFAFRGTVTVGGIIYPQGTYLLRQRNSSTALWQTTILNGDAQDLQAVLDEGSTASITLSNGSVYAVNMPFDDILDIYVSDSITSSDGNTQFIRSLQEGFIGNGATTNIGDITLVNQNNLSVPFENSGDYNTINSLYKADNAISESGSFAIQVPTPKIFPSFGEVILRYPYIETEGIYTLATTDDIPVYTTPSLKEVLAVEGRMPFMVTADYVLESTNKGETIVVDNSVSAVRLDLVGLDFAIGDEIEIYNSNCTNLGLNIVFSSGAIINYKGVAYDESAGNIPLPIYSKSWLKCIDVDIFELVIIEQNDLTGYVPYTGATADVNLGEFGLLTGNIEFDNTPTNIPTAAGSMYWNDSDGTTDLILKGGNVKLQVGQEQVIRVVNKTATNVDLLESNYQAVRVTGAQGQRLKVDLAQATNDLLSAETIGLVTETINNNQEGFITTSGLVRNINTTGSIQGETWADGDILYLSPTTPGLATKVKPVAPDHLVILGYVVHAHITQGSIFVKVDNGYELDELHNVKITSPQGGQALIYNQSLQIWENKIILDYTNNFLLMGG